MDPSMTISCPCCHHHNAPWRKHCGGCGSGLPGGCPSCGAVNELTDRFCGGCAHPLRRPSWKLKATKSHDSTMPIDVMRDVVVDR
jgi:hypothetical protein